ncbi:calmodulin-1 [Anaeramoeba ignava]|uniref:Calmodulin-1 n=1 Tax=Anaeramoeba ignava TaxID=1746090 RepID=A0A9Q0LUH4_ANAIG|nr:calmodulin-1 [Anaeramoeba ignava]|eukprot:Anaeramoba_ignava/a607507_194.p1 GENE.a607507_194~~a607507_194.p1  ORF type:complete len:148 (-),score=60.18 a607507_194:167-610(-)
MDLSNDQIAEFKEAFNLFDKDGDGKITSKEVGVVMRSLGVNPTEAELQDIVNDIDANMNGFIEFQSFVNLIKKKMQDEDKPEDIIAAFKVFDRDGHGYIATHELYHILTTIGEPLTKEEADQLEQEADKEKSGRVNYAEFVNLMLAK